jgi:alpha-beta hydrolase superfamily lysophospholipase
MNGGIMLKSQFKSFDNKEISYLFFESTRNEVKKNILILHGMMETKERYAEFSEFLANNGYNVFIFDLRGHGDFSTDSRPIYFEKDENAYTILKDVEFFTKNIIKETPVIFGHSLGSVLTLRCAEEHSETDSFILSAYPEINAFSRFFGKIWTGLEGIFVRKGKSLLNKKFKSYNKHFKPNKTEYDWLTRDEAEARKYAADPKCGFYATPRFFRNFLKILGDSARHMKDVNNNAKILMIYGTEDMAAGRGKSMEKIKDKLKSIDRKINIIENKDGRHESLNEINKYEIYDSVLGWLNKQYEIKI